MSEIKQAQVDWAKVAVMSAVGAALPLLLGLVAKHKFAADYAEATRVRWTDANRWER
jgi:hypothetical protein